MVKLLAERAPAKINLFLRVTDRRSDGYHRIDSIFLPVSIADSITIEVRSAASASVVLRCDTTSLNNAASLDDPESNLAVRAARAFVDAFGVTGQILVDLKKTIPIGAGLGGGSSDAGTVLRMLAALYRIGNLERLGPIALRLGADVTFFLDPRASRVGGIGERISPIRDFPKLPLVIAVPPVEVPTAAIFKALRPEHWSGPAPERDIEEILAGQIGRRHLVNDLAAPAFAQFPQIAELKELLERSGAETAAMTGSGGAVFGIFRDRDSAQSAARDVQSGAPSVQVFAATVVG